MIILTLLNLFFSLITTLFNTFTFPSIPSNIYDIFTDFIDMLGDAFSCVFFFLPAAAVYIALLALSIEIVYKTYIFIMWIVRKLPFGTE